jgi:hypothetical protein
VKLATKGLALGVLVVAGLGMSGVDWFGNHKSNTTRGPQAEPTKAAPVATESKPTHRHVVIRYEHQKPRANDMVVAWDFGNGNAGSEIINKAVAAFEKDATVEVGTSVSGWVQLFNGEYVPGEATKIRIYIDDKPNCPDHFFGQGKRTTCGPIVVN